jgi:hypothetical protein
MSWLHRIGRAPQVDAPAPADAEQQPVEGAAPGAAALFAGVKQDRSHAVIDLGAATGESLRVYSRYARWVRFADLLGDAWHPPVQRSAVALLKTIGPHPERPYDLVFAWDILDRLFPGDRPHLVEWLADVAASDARLHVVIRTAHDEPMQPLRFSLLDVDRLRFEPTGTTRLPPSRLLPADVTKLLAPLQIVHAFTLKTGFREYVAVRR